jgi:hypothetical protein
MERASDSLRPNRRYSVLSYCSAFSSVSAFTVVAFLSCLSAASVLSFGSIGSTLSVLSIGSVYSVLSVGSTGCTLGIFQDCSVDPKTDSWIEISLDADAWDDLASCTKEEYNMKNRPPQCDYKIATCAYSGGDPQPCRVRRKGNASWRKMEDGSSLKVKFDTKVNFGTEVCVDGEYCPGGRTNNTWTTKKLTLNNMAQGDKEVEAYREFGKYMAAPMAKYTSLSLFRGGKLFSKRRYAMVETVDDKPFLEKHFGLNYTLHEIEYDKVYFERAEGSLSGEDVKIDLLNIPLDSINRDHALRYYALELTTRHWDGACGRDFKNNYFVVYNGQIHFLIPWGLDQTFQYCSKAGSILKAEPKCLFMQQCFNSSSCETEFAARLGAARRENDAETDCITRYQVLERSFFSLFGAVALVFFSMCAGANPDPLKRRTPVSFVPRDTSSKNLKIYFYGISDNRARRLRVNSTFLFPRRT